VLLSYLLIRQDLWPFVKFIVEKVRTVVGVTRNVSVLIVMFRLATRVVVDTLVKLWSGSADRQDIVEAYRR
jgi:hypothetical protein